MYAHVDCFLVSKELLEQSRKQGKPKSTLCCWNPRPFSVALGFVYHIYRLKAPLTLLCGIPATCMETAVLVHTRKELEFAGKKTLVPQDLILTFDGEEWLKLPSYSPFLLQVLAGKGVVMKNSTMKNSQLLQDLLAQRNQAVQNKQSEKHTPDVLGLESQEGQAKTPSKKRKACNLEEMSKVTLCIKGQDVLVVCPTFRSEQSSLAVKLDSHMLALVFEYLKPDVLPLLKKPKSSE